MCFCIDFNVIQIKDNLKHTIQTFSDLVFWFLLIGFLAFSLSLIHSTRICITWSLGSLQTLSQDVWSQLLAQLFSDISDRKCRTNKRRAGERDGSVLGEMDLMSVTAETRSLLRRSFSLNVNPSRIFFPTRCVLRKRKEKKIPHTLS